jgi:hypothetical protein
MGQLVKNRVQLSRRRLQLLLCLHDLSPYRFNGAPGFCCPAMEYIANTVPNRERLVLKGYRLF